MRRHRAGEQMFHWYSVQVGGGAYAACTSGGYRTVEHLIRRPSPSIWSRLTCLVCHTLQRYKLWWVLSPRAGQHTHKNTVCLFFIYSILLKVMNRQQQQIISDWNKYWKTLQCYSHSHPVEMPLVSHFTSARCDTQSGLKACYVISTS